MSERSLGGHQPPSTIHDDLRPGQQPQPSEGYQGPPISIPIEEYERTRKAIDDLGREVGKLGFDIVTGIAQTQTNSSGVAVLGLYQVAAGVEARLNRLTMNAAVPATNVSYTFAVPYSNAAAYIQLYAAEVGDQANALSNAGLLDGGPPVAAGAILPCVFSWEIEAAPCVRGPMWFVAYLVGGPVSAPLTARYQIGLKRSAGIA